MTLQLENMQNIKLAELDQNTPSSIMRLTKKFQPFVKPDIAAYIDIVAAESNQTTTSDAAIVVPWDEFIRRILEKEAFLNTYPNSNRTSMEPVLHKYGME